jgi:hypothetical protein
MRTIFRFALTALMGLASAPGLLWGQAATGTGSISGRVTDATGAAVPSATVTITDTSTKISTSATTNREGFFVFANLTPANYDVKVSKQGFKEAAVVGQDLLVGQTLTVNVSLEVGAATQTVR